MYRSEGGRGRSRRVLVAVRNAARGRVSGDDEALICFPLINDGKEVGQDTKPGEGSRLPPPPPLFCPPTLLLIYECIVAGQKRSTACEAACTCPSRPPLQPHPISNTKPDERSGDSKGKAPPLVSPKSFAFASFGSALHARASSIRNVKLPGVRPSIHRKGSMNTPGSIVSAASVGEEKETEMVGALRVGTAESAVALPEVGSSAAKHGKNVAWEDAGKEDDHEAGEKVCERRIENCYRTFAMPF